MAVFLLVMLIAGLTLCEAQTNTTNSTEATLCDVCICSSLNDTVDVACDGRSMTEIVLDVPRGVGLLDLSHNALTSAKVSSSGSRIQIRELILKKNNIQHIAEPDFYHVKGLRTLDLSWNKIADILGRPFIYVKKLRVLDLSNNILRDIPVGLFSSLLELQTLCLSRNPLHNIGPTMFSMMPSILSLDLSNTALSDLHRDTFKEDYKLKYLNLAWNHFQTIPTHAFEDLYRLEHLKLTGNPIHIIDQRSLRFPTSLVEIDLDQMPVLSEVHAKAFSRQLSLAAVNISHNRMLTFFDATAFKNVRSLRNIDLSNNHLNKIENGVELSLLCHDFELDLSGNPWSCDCHLTWILGCKFAANTSLGICAHPNRMEGFEVKLLEDDELTCDDDLWVFGFGKINKKLGIVLLFLGLVGLLISGAGIFVMLKYRPKITWNRRVKDKNEDIHYLRMEARDPDDKPARY